jgi:serine/threonine-protein kinase
MSADSAALRLPRRLGPYVLLRHLGSGGMADVYLAKERGGLGVERLVALKTIRRSSNVQEAARLQSFFEREARVAAAQSHQNIVQVFDAGSIDGTLFLAMEFIQGRTLAQVMDRIRMDLAAITYLGGEILAGLAHLHGRRDLEGKPLGLVHRDVSPQNVLLSYAGAVKLADFGLAKATEGAEQADSTEGPKGKAAYMSPEQAYGLELDARADLFSVAIVLFELCTGKRLYGGRRKNQLQVLTVARRARIPDLAETYPYLPAPFCAVLQRALQKNPADRYGTAEEMAGELRRAVPESFSSQQLAQLLSRQFGLETRREQDQLVLDNRAAAALEAGQTALVTPLPAPRRSRPAIVGIVGALLLAGAAIAAIELWPRAPQRSTARAPRDARAPAASRPARLDARTVERAAVTDAASASRPIRPGRPSGFGQLSVGSQPWARIYLDGRLLGNTPVVDLRVPAGNHVLRLVCPTTGKTRQVRLRIASQKRVQRIFDLR